MTPDALVKVTRCPVGIIVDAFGRRRRGRPLVDALLASLAAAGVATMSRPLPCRLYAGEERTVAALADQVAGWCTNHGVDVAVADLAGSQRWS